MNINSVTNTAFSSPVTRQLQGGLAAASFSLLLAGTNLTTPLIPLYKNKLGFSPLLMSMTFVVYVSILIGVLIALSKPSFVKHSPKLLSAALALAVIADMLLGSATEFGIMAGRGVAGIAGGLGTGSAAALVVGALGVKGRSVSATGNLIGAVVGTVYCQYCVTHFSDQSMTLVFHVHASACIIMMFLLVCVLNVNKKANQLLLQPKVDTVKLSSKGLRNYFIPLSVGCVSWIAISCSIVFLPSYFDTLHMTNVTSFGVIIMLVLCAIGQLGSPALTKSLPRSSGMFNLIAGTLFIVIAPYFKSELLAIVGFGAIGIGVGISYRLCLIVFTKGASPSEHGSRSSFYAAITYFMAALFILLTGMVGNSVGLVSSVFGLFVLIAFLIVILFSKAPILKDTLE